MMVQASRLADKHFEKRYVSNLLLRQMSVPGLEQGKLYYSTSEFGKGELSPTSAKTFFMVSHDGIWDVEFTDSSVVTKSKNYSYVAKSLSPQPIEADNQSLDDTRSSANR